jgi:hypothetical protein
MPLIVKVKSFTRDIEHTVRQLSDGSWHCDCEHFTYRGYKEGKCDHILKARHKRLQFHSRKLILERKIEKAKITYNHLVRRYKAKKEKLIKTNIGRVTTIEKLYTQLEELRTKILKLYKIIK